MSEEAVPASGRIGLALSGGGFRAAAFHLGVLRYMAEVGLLQQVTQISTVSGGSLVAGAVFSASGGRWPSSAEFLQNVYPSVKEMLVSEDLFSFRALRLGGILRQNTRILFRRANVLAWLIRKRWDVSLRLSDLPETPVWHINTTSLETGKNWRFTRDSMGDWQFGRHYSPDVAVADAMAASAAVPYVIGALRLTLPKEGWWQTDPATKAPMRKVKPGQTSVRLWDGGAYENMALEPVYKPMAGLIGCDFLMCSDASAPLTQPTGVLKSLLAGKLASPRLFDISSDQIRALRSRMLMKSIRQGEIKGLLFRLGTSARDLAAVAGSLPGLTDEECAFCLNYPTNLTRVRPDHFDLIAQHGHEVARMTARKFGVSNTA